MATDAGCEIARLPEELVSAAIALTTPRDAARAAAVSRAFRAAADSDAVWSRFLPRDLPPLAAAEEPEPLSSPAPPPMPSDKARFLRLSDPDRPALLADRLMSVWLDRETGAKCYMLSARALHISRGDTPVYWRWIPLTGSRFSEAAELVFAWWLEIRGKIERNLLSPDSNYAAYIVFKITATSYGLDDPPQDATVSVDGRTSAHKVCLDNSWRRYRARRNFGSPLYHRNVVLPKERAHGWLELELGAFYNDGGCDDGEVCASLLETEAGVARGGLIVQGIEIRAKKQG